MANMRGFSLPSAAPGHGGTTAAGPKATAKRAHAKAVAAHGRDLLITFDNNSSSLTGCQVVVSCTLANDWPQFQHDAIHFGVNLAENAFSVATLETPLQIAFKAHFGTNSASEVGAVEAGGLLYVADAGSEATQFLGALSVFDAAGCSGPLGGSCEPLWRAVPGGGGITTTPAVSNGFVMIASHGRQPLAAAVFLNWNRTVVYKYGASDSNAWRLRPNHLLFWEAIRWSAENGYQTFDFGRSEAAQQGLREFKSGWGTEEVPLTYSMIRDRTNVSADTSRVAGWTSAAGGAVIRRSPAWVARLLGEVLYKYAA